MSFQIYDHFLKRYNIRGDKNVYFKIIYNINFHYKISIFFISLKIFLI